MKLIKLTTGKSTHILAQVANIKEIFSYSDGTNPEYKSQITWIDGDKTYVQEDLVQIQELANQP